MDASPLKKKTKLFYSGNCEACLKKATYYRHKAEFYN